MLPASARCGRQSPKAPTTRPPPAPTRVSPSPRRPARSPSTTSPAPRSMPATSPQPSRRPVTVTVDAGQHKTYGASDPAAFTYSITSGSLAFSDTFIGALNRAAGENVGTYAIGQNTLSLGPNYLLSFVGDDFTIAQRPVTVTVDAGQHKTY